ncbi:MAG: hypothetical protein OHK0017_06540 [Patescibacteria group bacterium]
MSESNIPSKKLSAGEIVEFIQKVDPISAEQDVSSHKEEEVLRRAIFLLQDVLSMEPEELLLLRAKLQKIHLKDRSQTEDSVNQLNEKELLQITLQQMISEKIPHVQKLQKEIQDNQNILNLENYIKSQLQVEGDRTEIFNQILLKARSLRQSYDTFRKKLTDKTEDLISSYPTLEKILRQQEALDPKKNFTFIVSLITGLDLEKTNILYQLADDSSTVANEQNHPINKTRHYIKSIEDRSKYSFSDLKANQFMNLPKILEDLHLAEQAISDLDLDEKNWDENLVRNLLKNEPNRSYNVHEYGFDFKSKIFNDLFKKAESSYKELYGKDAEFVDHSRGGMYICPIVFPFSRYEQNIEKLSKELTQLNQDLLLRFNSLQHDDLVELHRYNDQDTSFVLASKDKSRTFYIKNVVNEIREKRASINQIVTNEAKKLTNFYKNNPEIKLVFNNLLGLIDQLVNTAIQGVIDQKTQQYTDLYIRQITEYVARVQDFKPTFELFGFKGFSEGNWQDIRSNLTLIACEVEKLNSTHLEDPNFRDDSILLNFRAKTYTSDSKGTRLEDGVFIKYSELIQLVNRKSVDIVM